MFILLKVLTCLLLLLAGLQTWVKDECLTYKNNISCNTDYEMVLYLGPKGIYKKWLKA